MITRIQFEDADDSRYVYYDSNTRCVYIGRSNNAGNEFVAFTVDEWRRISVFRVEPKEREKVDAV